VSNVFRIPALAAIVLALAACGPRATDNLRSNAIDAQRSRLGDLHIQNVFKQPVHAGLTTVRASRETIADALTISFDPKFVTPDEIDEAGRLYCENALRGRKPQLLKLIIGDRDRRASVQEVGTAQFFCTNGSAEDEAKLARLGGYERSASALAEDAERVGTLQGMLEQMRKSREGWEALKQRDLQRAGASPAYQYQPVK